MNRRTFLNSSAGVSLGMAAGLGGCTGDEQKKEPHRQKATGKPFPLAISMWEFSWLERKWPGAGYEDWDLALSELVERGYDAVRIDAFPHLVYHDPGKEYLLYPHWSVQDWGSPGMNRVQVMPALNEFLERCRHYQVRAGLSSWFRKDEDDVRMNLNTPEKHAEAWLTVLRAINKAGLLDTILYVDLCNEWTGDAWCPFFVNDPPEARWSGWDTQKSIHWMKTSIAIIKDEFPEIPCTFSITEEVSDKILHKGDVSMLDLMEHHIWMTSYNQGEFYREAGYTYDRFDNKGYRNMALNGKKLYESRKAYWQKGLTGQIETAAEWSKIVDRPLITTECWGVVDYKDWPLLDWDYVKELCALGTETAARTGRWLAIATSNFCGPQFVGMWRDIEWHRKLTDIIHASQPDPGLQDSLPGKRMKDIAAQMA